MGSLVEDRRSSDKTRRSPERPRAQRAQSVSLRMAIKYTVKYIIISTQAKTTWRRRLQRPGHSSVSIVSDAPQVNSSLENKTIEIVLMLIVLHTVPLGFHLAPRKDRSRDAGERDGGASGDARDGGGSQRKMGWASEMYIKK